MNTIKSYEGTSFLQDALVNDVKASINELKAVGKTLGFISIVAFVKYTGDVSITFCACDDAGKKTPECASLEDAIHLLLNQEPMALIVKADGTVSREPKNKELTNDPTAQAEQQFNERSE